MKHPEVIAETDRLILRRWREADQQPFFHINSDARAMEFFPGLLSRQESDSFVERIETHFKSHGFGLCAAELKEDQRFIGYIGLSIPNWEAPFSPCVEIAWRLDPQDWGRGLATEGANRMARHAFETLGLDEILSFTVPANIRSRRVMEKIGMSHEPIDDFEHPLLPVGHSLRKHVLYRLSRKHWESIPR